MRQHASLLVVALALVAVLFTGCASEETTGLKDVTSEAPALPPSQTMTFDFGFFETNQDAAATLQAAKTNGTSLTQWNWLNAVVRVAYINLAVAQTFYPPAAAFEAAIHTIPSPQGENEYLWIYTWVEPDGHEVQIRLRGTILRDVVEWELRVTDEQADPPLDQALWFYGETNRDEDGGFWVFNDLEEEREVEAARIDWTIKDDTHVELRFENILRGDDEFGDTLTYSLQGTRSTIEYFDASDDLLSDITWDEETGAGSLQVADYNDGERACWDEEQNDVDCNELDT